MSRSAEMDNLDQVVRDICEFNGDVMHRKYAVVLKRCVWALRDMGLRELPNHKSRSIPVDGMLTATLPRDCIVPVKVGICRNGMISHIYYNKNLCKKMDSNFATQCCPAESAGDSEPAYQADISHPWISSFYDFGAYWTGQAYAPWYEHYTMQPGMALFGTFVHNKEFDRLEFSTSTGLSEGDEVILYYNADYAEDSSLIVPLEVKEALNYKCKEELWSRSGSESLMNKNEYLRERRRIRKIKNQLPIEEWSKAFTYGRHAGIKR